jgi:hypothetical protein
VIGILTNLLSGPAGATALGAVLKLFNTWVQGRIEKQQMEAAREEKILDTWAKSQIAITKDRQSKTTRRWVFWMLTATYCFVFVWFTNFPETTIITLGGHSSGWITNIFGGATDALVTVTGGHVVVAGLELIFMVVGFFALPSRRR